MRIGVGLMVLSAFSACTSAPDRASAPPPPAAITVFAAASLGPTLDGLRPLFAALHPNVELRVELSGSRLACTKISEQRRAADLLLSADYELIDTMLRPEHAAFNLIFATNPLVLAYNAQGAAGAQLTAGAPWQEVLAREDVAVGLATPAAAPVGYRALLALQLNDKVAPEPLRTGGKIASRLSERHMRPDVTKLLAPLQTGDIDVAFVYRSEAKLHGMPFVELDPRVNFGDAQHQELYASVSTTLPALGNQPAQTVRGSASVYGLTIPKAAPNEALALDLVRLLLSEEGRKVAQERFVDIFPAEARRVNGVPPVALQSLAVHP